MVCRRKEDCCWVQVHLATLTYWGTARFQILVSVSLDSVHCDCLLYAVCIQYCQVLFQLTFVKTDFNKWKDEDDSDVDEKEDYNLDEVYCRM